MLVAYRILMDGAQQNPAVTTTARGTGLAIFDSVGLTVDYFINVNGTAAGGLDYGPFYGQPAQTPADNQDNVVDAHFHGLAARGSNAGVIFDWKNHDDDDVLQLLPDGSWFLQGRWENSDGGSDLAGVIFDAF